MFQSIDVEWASEIISYIDDPAIYLDEIGVQSVVDVINAMDADDAVDLLEGLSADLKEKIRFRSDRGMCWPFPLSGYSCFQSCRDSGTHVFLTGSGSIRLWLPGH